MKPILTEDLKNNGVPLSGHCFSAELANDFATERQRRVAKMHAQIESVSWFYSSRAYPTLRNEHLTNAWRYVRAHWQEIENQIRENKDA